jgi:hypothetical protein
MTDKVGRLAQIVGDLAMWASSSAPADVKPLIIECAREAAAIAEADWKSEVAPDPEDEFHEAYGAMLHAMRPRDDRRDDQ